MNTTYITTEKRHDNAPKSDAHGGAPNSNLPSATRIEVPLSAAQFDALASFARHFRVNVGEAMRLLAFVAATTLIEDDELRAQVENLKDALDRGEWDIHDHQSVCGCVPILPRDRVIDEGAVSVDLAAPILLEIGGRLAATARWNAFLIGKTPQETIRTELIECFKMQLARSFSDDESAACRWLEELAVATRG